MNNKTLSIFLKSLILLTPLPFGCVGRIFSPLFYILLLVFSLMALEQTGKPFSFLHEKKVLTFFYGFLGFLALQIIPLPLFLLKLFSPGTVRNLTQLKDQVPGFHPISTVPLETLIFGFKFLVFALFFWVMIRIKFEKKDIISILKTLILSSVLQVILGLLKYLQGNRLFFLFFHQVDSSDPVVRYLTGTLGNPNHFAFYLEMIFPLILALFFLKLQFLEAGRSLRERFLAVLDKEKSITAYFAGPVLLGVGITLTGSRAGIMTMIFSFIIFAQLSFYLRQRKSIRKKLKLIFLGITAVALFIGVQNTVNEFMKTGFSSAGRFMRWPATFGMFLDFPLLGTGFGTYRYAYFLYDIDPLGAWSTHAHNDFLQALAEGGIIGSALFFLVIGIVIYSIVKMWGIRKHPEVKMIGIGIITSLFAAVFHSFFDFSLRIPANVFTFVLVLALGIKMVTYKRDFKDINNPQ